MTTQRIRFPRKIPVFAAFVLALLITKFQPTAFAENAQSVQQWDIFEIELAAPSDGNPFLNVQLSATFTDGTRTQEIPGFYDGAGVYRIRFMPEKIGEWRYETHSNRAELNGKTGVLTVTPPTSEKNHEHA